MKLRVLVVSSLTLGASACGVPEDNVSTDGAASVSPAAGSSAGGASLGGGAVPPSSAPAGVGNPANGIGDTGSVGQPESEGSSGVANPASSDPQGSALPSSDSAGEGGSSSETPNAESPTQSDAEAGDSDAIGPSGSEPSGSEPSESEPSGSEPIDGMPDADGAAGQSPADVSEEIFAADRLPRFDLELPPSSLEALSQVTDQDDPRQDLYVRATFRYEGETLTDVGVRIKGEGSFQGLDRKPAWKLKFDEFVEQQRFRGLARMALNNLFEDPSFIAERLAYDVYRAAGVPAPRCNNALVYVNGTFYGVYANVEAEDKSFLRRWFEDDDGNLYEEGQVDFVPGAEVDFDLETNEAENDRTDLVQLIDALQSSTDPERFLADLGAYVDTENFLRFTAVEAAVNQWDMYSYTVFWVNNMRLYNDPSSGKFHFIPWGHDLSMKPFRDSGKPYIRLFELARQGDFPNASVTSGLLFQRCLGSAPCVAAYREVVREVMSIYDGLDLEARANAYHAQIESAVYEDTRKNVCCERPPTLTNDAFEAGHESVLATIRGRTSALAADLGE